MIKSPPYSKKCQTMLSFILPFTEESWETAHPDQIKAVEECVGAYFEFHLREAGCSHCADTATVAIDKGTYRPLNAWKILCGAGAGAAK